MMNHKILSFLLAVMIFTGCRKNGQEQVASASDIQYRVFHQTFSADSSQSAMLDLDSNGYGDFNILVAISALQDTFRVTRFQVELLSNSTIQTQKTPVIIKYPNGLYATCYLPDWYSDTGSWIDTVNRSWNSISTYISIYTILEYAQLSKVKEAISIPLGQTGFLGIRIQKYGDYYYGWMQIRMDTDGKSFEVIDAAVARKPGMLIRIGQKQ